jgi:polyhydroxyalkanoate synthesis regulator phasin
MRLKKTITILSVGALAVAAVFGVIAYRTVRAQETTPTAPAAPGPSNPGPGHPGFGRGFGGGYSNEDLANALGITVDELTAAYQKADSAMLDQAVKDGLITQAQADQLKAKTAGFPFGGPWEGWLNQSGIDYNALLADALGITVEKLQTAYTQAFNARIDQAVTAGNLTQDQADLMKGEYALRNSQSFQSAMQSAYQNAVKQAVTDGVITQAQADQILKNGNGIEPGGFGELPGRGFGDFGRHGGWGGGAPPNPASPQTPDATPSSGL